MNKIIPFNKDITFNSTIGEITSIALDDTLKLVDEYAIKGDLIVRGCNKVQEQEEEFSYALPVDIAIDSKYDTSKCSISIDDFYYEIINESILKVKIDLLLDDLFYKEEPIQNTEIVVPLPVDEAKHGGKEGLEEINLTKELANRTSKELEDRKFDLNASIQKEGKDLDIDLDLLKDNVNVSFDLEKKASVIDKPDSESNANNIEDLFKEINEEKEYSIYRVYTVTENDSLEYIMDKYKVSRDDLADYNDLSKLTPGMKLVIPSTDE